MISADHHSHPVTTPFSAAKPRKSMGKSYSVRHDLVHFDLNVQLPANLAELACELGNMAEDITISSTKNSLRGDGGPCSGSIKGGIQRPKRPVSEASLRPLRT